MISLLVAGLLTFTSPDLPPDVPLNTLTDVELSGWFNYNPCPSPNPNHSPSQPFNARAIEACIRYVWPDEIEDRAVAIVFGVSSNGEAAKLFKDGRRCIESGGNPNALGGAKELGVFQIHPTHFSGRKGFVTKLGYTKEDLYNPQVNAEMALYLYEVSKGGWKNWTCAPVKRWGRKG